MSKFMQPSDDHLKNIIGRFTKNGIVCEEAVDYLYRILDRQISKSVGLLAYNALFLAAFSSAASKTPNHILLVARIWALFAATLVMPLLRLKWEKATDYSSAAADVKAIFKTLKWRTRYVNLSVFASFVTSILGALGMLGWKI